MGRMVLEYHVDDVATSGIGAIRSHPLLLDSWVDLNPDDGDESA